MIQQIIEGALPNRSLAQTQAYLLANRVILPGPSTLRRLTGHVSSTVHAQLYQQMAASLSPGLVTHINALLNESEEGSRSIFYQLKAYPPSANPTTLNHYYTLYQRIVDLDIDAFDPSDFHSQLRQTPVSID